MDWLVLLAPILLLPIVALLGFIGCQLVFPLQAPPGLAPKVRINCGGLAVADVDLAWEADDTNPVGSARTNPGNPVVDTAGVIANPVYDTCRLGDTGADVSYVRTVGQGTVVVTLKFAWFFTSQNDFLPFGIWISGNGAAAPVSDEFNFKRDVFNVSANAGVAFDLVSPDVKVDEAGNVAVTFIKTGGNFPYINAIEISKYEDPG